MADLVVKDDREERALHPDVAAVVLDEAEIAELVHEEIDARPGRADNLRERFLRHLRDRQRLIPLPVARQQQQDTGEPLFARVEQLVDQVLLHTDVSRQHVREEPFGQRRLRVEHLEHLWLFDDEHRARRHRRRGRDAPRLCGETALTKEVTLTQDGDDGLFTGPRENGELDAAVLNVEDIGGWLPLREDDG